MALQQVPAALTQKWLPLELPACLKITTGIYSSLSAMFTINLNNRLLKVDQVPLHFREIAIISGYRHPCSTPLQCLFSIFEANNETMNFWTHFIPTWYFIWKLGVISEELVFLDDPYTWPFLTFLLTCCIYPPVSCIAHTFSTMSVTARHICFFIDYSALSIYSFGCALMYRAYIFPEVLLQSYFSSFFLLFAVLISLACTWFSCLSRFINHSGWRKCFRFMAFAMPYLYVSFPLAYRVLYCVGDECETGSFPYHYKQFFIAGTASFLYITHFPERLAPGKFDIVGHSHQLFHICGVLATYEQIQAGIIDMIQRKKFLQSHRYDLSILWSIIFPAFVTFFNLAIVVKFSMMMLRKKNIKKEDATYHG